MCVCVYRNHAGRSVRADESQRRARAEGVCVCAVTDVYKGQPGVSRDGVTGEARTNAKQPRLFHAFRHATS